MDTVITLLVLSTLSQLVVGLPQAVLEIVSGDSRIFSGESAQLKCSIPDIYNSSWSYLWFRGSEQLPQHGENLLLWKPRVRDSGKFYCQGVRSTAVGKIRTIQSQPKEISVEGGWAILQVPPHPGLVGDTLKVTCRVRGTPTLHEVILYKDGVEVQRQRGLNPNFYLTNLTVEDQGKYSCRASWDIQVRTRSVISATSPVQVLEVLSQPILEILTDNNVVPAKMMKLICHHQYNAPAPAPQVNYYFYKNDNRVGPSTSDNHYQVNRAPGQYRCKARVPKLGLSRWSEVKNFGQVPGPQMRMPPILKPRNPLTLAFPSSLPSAVKPTTAPPPPRQSTAAPTFVQPTEVSTPPAASFSSQSAPSTLPSTVQSLNQTAMPETEESGDTYEDSGDMYEESGDMSAESGDTSNESTDMPMDSQYTDPK